MPVFRPILLRRLAAGVLVLLVAALLPAGGGAQDAPGIHHDRARAARERGEVLPLERILAIVERDFPGRVIEVELERENGRLIYEIELLLADGRVLEAEFDAQSGELVGLEGARLETLFQPRPRSGAASR